MAFPGTKLSELGALSVADILDLLAVVDVSDTTQGPGGTTKKLTIAGLLRSLGIQGSTIATSQTQTEGAAYGNLATTGPQVSLTTGALVLVILSMRYAHRNPGVGFMAVEVSGATTTAAADANAVEVSPQNTLGHTATLVKLMAVTAGSNTFTAKYRNITSSGGATPTFSNRTLVVIPLN